jgi:DNA polymerase III epsilon subunit-like protein
MLDIETLGTSPGCLILSIGAVKFESGEEFYRVLTPDSRFTIDPYTVFWWLAQPEKARLAISSGIGELPQTVLKDLLAFIGSAPVWGNGVAFDNACVAAYCNVLGFKWPYRQDRCYRTIKGFYSGELTVQAPELAHHPIEDCKYQITCLRVMAESLGLEL